MFAATETADGDAGCRLPWEGTGDPHLNFTTEDSIGAMSRKQPECVPLYPSVCAPLVTNSFVFIT